jgi:hypothetical protein
VAPWQSVVSRARLRAPSRPAACVRCSAAGALQPACVGDGRPANCPTAPVAFRAPSSHACGLPAAPSQLQLQQASPCTATAAWEACAPLLTARSWRQDSRRRHIRR